MSKHLKKIDWISILLYFILVFIGWITIYSTTVENHSLSLFNISTMYGKQLTFIGLSIGLIIFILALEAKFYEQFSGVFYIISLVSLAGLFLFGKNINGATSWYAIGPMTLQPSEFAKAATALAVAKYWSDIQRNLSNSRDQILGFCIISIPAILIILQPDPGSALVYGSFFFVFYREGLPGIYLFVAMAMVLVFICTLLIGPIWVGVSMAILLLIYYVLKQRKKKKTNRIAMVVSFILVVIFSLSVQFIFDTVFEQRHRDRIGLWLRLEKNPEKLAKIKKTIGYNTYQSEAAISSGGFSGKGFLQGTRTKGDFVPEQHTDYIFSTVGEEWGFLGTASVVVLFGLLLVRLLFLAERQKSQFSRIYGYSVVVILFFHVFINIGMVIGLLPTVGIPLPFFSYGGSGLWGFTILLFIFIKLDANRIHEW